MGVFETATGKPLGSSPSHTGRVLWLGFSPDGRRLATAGSEGLARLWSTTTGAPIGPAMSHPGVNHVGFNPDQTFIMTTGMSGLIRVWDAESAARLTKGFDMPRGVESMGLGPGCRRVVFCLQSQPVPVTWELPFENRPVDEIEALSIVLSGHLIDSGERLSPAPQERVQAARATIVRREPTYFVE